ncbi:hypothetical protein PAL_GLEAN10012059 [Pteropus alecto]|uniref:Uncharacterized protein n=1 Tax=Pteropus alecto TaxID=9402 RepID=L5K5X6_PTEAL|nr:hypothetical protein PAL_GLEAN10012059 [Pteropus alecto]
MAKYWRQQRQSSTSAKLGSVVKQQQSPLPVFHLLAPSSARILDSIPREPCACCQRILSNCPLSNKKFKLQLSHYVRF